MRHLPCLALVPLLCATLAACGGGPMMEGGYPELLPLDQLLNDTSEPDYAGTSTLESRAAALRAKAAALRAEPTDGTSQGTN
ncbi:hypothetical protein [Thioclava sp. GXIMD4216]|uniref:DUF4398 domain-containing protein n=1 Tax=Thioclava litoralis TaxID=3076557 RepID=A0ABZ1DZF5_9RHOB|nr:hypothetical protein RPE78_02530 [Thioclava sp. FTW29]